MKKLKTTIYVIASLMTVVWLSGNNHLYKGLYDTYLQGRSKPGIDNPDLFHTRIIKRAERTKAWPKSFKYNTAKASKEAIDVHKSHESVAYLVIKGDSLLSEQYYESYDSTSISNSFSMAKTFLSVLVGKAIFEGKMRADQAVTELIPDFVEAKDSALQIKHLLNMSSGMNFDESYGNPFGFMAKAYYGTDLKELLKGYELEKQPGTCWKYLGGNNLLLSLALEKAVGMKVSDYASEKIWQPLGMENDAQWILDHKDGDEKTFSGLYATARDFAKIGKFYLDYGQVDGTQLIDTDYIVNSISPVNIKDENQSLIDHYGYAWWLTTYENREVFYMQGILGQYVICIPDEDLIIVRLGRKRMEKTNGIQPDDLYLWIKEGIRISKQ